MNLKQHVALANLIDESNSSIYHNFAKTESCSNNSMEFNGVPIGFDLSRQKILGHVDYSNIMKESRSVVGLDLRDIDNRSVPFTVNSEMLLNGSNSIIPVSDNQIQSSFELHSLRASNSILQYPIAVHESMIAMPFSSLGVQLLRDHSTGHLLFLPSSSGAMDALHPTIIWPSFQQLPQTNQLPHIVFPTIQQTIPVSFAPLHVTRSDFLTNATLHQHTQTKLVAVSTPDNTRRIVIGPKLQNAPIKLDDKSDTKYEYKSEFPSKVMCHSEKFVKSALQFSEEAKNAGFSKIQQNNSTQINSVFCETIANTSLLNNLNSQDNKNEISSSEYMQNIASDHFCYKETENVEYGRWPFMFEKHNCNLKNYKDDDNIKEDTLSKNLSEIKNNVMERECKNYSMEIVNNSPMAFPMITQENPRILKTDVCESNAPSIDFSGLELLSNISTEAIKSKVLNLKKEINKDESINYYCREEMNNEDNNYINESLETLQFNNSTLGGLNLLCALAEQRIQEEDSKTCHYSPKLFRKQRNRQKRHKIIRCNKIKKRNIKYEQKKVVRAEVNKKDFQKVFKEVTSKYNFCYISINKNKFEISSYFHVDAKWPSVAEIFRIMELKMMRKLSFISNKNVKKNGGTKSSVFAYRKNNLITNLYFNAYDTHSLQISSSKIESRSSSPSKNQTESIEISTSTLLAENNFQTENPILISKNSLKETLYDINAIKSLYNNTDENSKCISKVNIQPSVFSSHLSSQIRNIRLNNSNFLMDPVNSNINKGSASTNSIVLKLQKPNFSEFEKRNENNIRLCKLLKSSLSTKKVQKHSLIKHALMHTEEKKKIIDEHLRISEIHLREAKVRVLAAMGGLFYAGYLQPIEPPDVYAVTLDGERGNKPHILCREEVLRDVICDHNMRIRSVDARFGGASHDSHIWALSSERQFFQRCFNSGDKSSWLLGDSGYPLEPWLITPYRFAKEEKEKMKENLMKHILN